jgi:hypothetical protein
MPTLKDIAKKVGDLTVAYAPINKNLQAPKRGNLKKRLKAANTPNKVLVKNAEKTNIVQDVKYGIEFNIDYAPPGAKYGKFVEEGHKTRKKPGGRGKSYVKPNPFAQKAVKDPELKKMIKGYTKELASEIKKQLLAEFKKI